MLGGATSSLPYPKGVLNLLYGRDQKPAGRDRFTAEGVRDGCTKSPAGILAEGERMRAISFGNPRPNRGKDLPRHGSAVARIGDSDHACFRTVRVNELRGGRWTKRAGSRRTSLGCPSCCAKNPGARAKRKPRPKPGRKVCSFTREGYFMTPLDTLALTRRIRGDGAPCLRRESRYPHAMAQSKHPPGPPVDLAMWRNGVRGLSVACLNHACRHELIFGADDYPGDTELSWSSLKILR
jgi:hypothetical protein